MWLIVGELLYVVNTHVASALSRTFTHCLVNGAICHMVKALRLLPISAKNCAHFKRQ